MLELEQKPPKQRNNTILVSSCMASRISFRLKSFIAIEEELKASTRPKTIDSPLIDSFITEQAG